MGDHRGGDDLTHRRLSREGAVLDRDVLHVAEEVEAPRAALAADARLSRAAERRVEVAHEVAVDPDRAGDDAARPPARRARRRACRRTAASP